MPQRGAQPCGAGETASMDSRRVAVGMLGRAQRRLRDHDIAVMGWLTTEVQV
jgi:hypothetical protein